jgi:hypothetical protein
MTRLRLISFAAVVLASASGGGASSAQAPRLAYSRLSIGVVRGDGVLLPLASKENETWTVLRTYSSVGDRSLYKLVDAQSVPREGWTYVPWDSGVSLPLTILDTVTTDAHCDRQEGFTTNAPPGSKLDSPHLMSGIAIHGGDVSALRIEDHASSARRDEQSSRVARFVAQLTHALEAETASPQAIPPNERERVPVQITTLARDRVDHFGDVIDYYYFESHKRYRAVESYASGWLVSSRGSFSVLRTTAGIYRGGETARQRGRVLGVLRLRVRRSSVWVMEMRGYEGDIYEIVEPGSQQVLSVHGGGC